VPTFIKKNRRILIALGVLAGVALAGFAVLAAYGQILGSRNPYGGHNSYGMRDYLPAAQYKAAAAIVAGLNTRNPDNVDLLRFHGQPGSDSDNRAIADNITAALPPPGCQFSLVGTKDEGEQAHPSDLVPWYGTSVSHARGFDIDVRQLCPGRQPSTRSIRVIAIPSGMGGYWAEAALYPQAAAG
jgi:hypothetical protein